MNTAVSGAQATGRAAMGRFLNLQSCGSGIELV